MVSLEEVFKTGPSVAVIRDPGDPWQILAVSENGKQVGLHIQSKPLDLTTHIHGEDLDLVTRKLGAGMLQKKPSVIMRYRLICEGSSQWVEDCCTITYDLEGTPTIIGSILWITTLPLEWNLLLHGNEAWNLLNSKLRHDMLNQLTAILGYLELSEDMVTDPMLQDFFGKEQNAADKIREKLIFTREYQKIGLTEAGYTTITDLIAEAMGEAGCTKIAMDIKIPPVQVFADKIFKQALVRIFENIPAHAPDASVIRIRWSREPEGSILSIENDGKGIVANQKSRIFELGFGSGTGFGLFLAQKLLEIFGVSLRETGIPDSSFRIELIIPPEILKYQECS
ncbi:MAG TPA: PAS domain-containing sensor histidine kinase [Methanospirillum sp.]|nr:PAS domain-containing sensor histidine kinase [Methanospirillum sp.]